MNGRSLRIFLPPCALKMKIQTKESCWGKQHIKNQSKNVMTTVHFLPNDISEKNIEEMKSNSKLLHEI